MPAEDDEDEEEIEGEDEDIEAEDEEFDRPFGEEEIYGEGK